MAGLAWLLANYPMEILMKLLAYCTPAFLSAGLVILPFSLLAVEPPLVKTKPVQAWQAGIEKTLYCQVEVPYHYTVASESQAKLVHALPEGSQVEKGEVLAKQDDEYLQLALVEKTELLAQQQLQLDYNEKEFIRVSELDNLHVTGSELNQLDLLVEQSKSQVIAIKTQIDRLKKQISSLTHKAPADGQVSELTAAIGSFVAEGAPIMQFMATEDKELRCEVPVATFRQSQWLELVQFYLVGSTSNELRLKRVGKNVIAKQQTLPIWLEAEGTSLFVGELSKVTMRQAEDTLSKVDTSALIFDGKSKYVWRLTENNEVEKTPVSVMTNLTNAFVVKGDVKAGDRLVTVGQTGLKQGMKVNPVETQVGVTGASH